MSKNRFIQVLAGVLAVALLGTSDFLTGPDFSFDIFYLIPISLVAWSAGKGAGTFIALASGATWFIVHALENPGVAHSLLPYWNGLTQFSLFLLVGIILPLLKNRLDQEKALARTDFLTGAANKRNFLDALMNELARNRRYRQPFTVAYLDIDNFKFINDRFGHNAGDSLLRTISATIKGMIRASDVLARLGGDEFAILFPETQPEPAQIVTKRIQKSLLDVVQKNEWPVTFSIGVATYVTPPNSVEEILQKVDLLMYAAKNSGKNMVKHQVLGPVSV